MELRDYIKILRNSWAMITSITVIVALLTAAWSVIQPVKYESSATIVVNKPNPVPQRNASFYQYDKYYSIQASSLYADTLAAWLSSPQTAKEIFERAGYPVPNVNLKKLGRIFKPHRLPPVTLNVSVIDQDQTKAEKLAAAAVSVLQDRTLEQRKQDDPDNYFSLITGKPVAAESKQDLALNTIIGLIGGLILGLIAAFLRQYMKES